MAEGLLQNSRLTINKLNGDMNFVGIFFIIIGAIECISIVGAIVGIPLIISGLRLRESAASFGNFLTSGNEAALDNALERQSRFFFIVKILIIIALVLFVLEIIFFAAFLIPFIHSMQGGFSRSV
jgi:Na+/H+-translocating membrane pyrophosphatase